MAMAKFQNASAGTNLGHGQMALPSDKGRHIFQLTSGSEKPEIGRGASPDRHWDRIRISKSQRCRECFPKMRRR